MTQDKLDNPAAAAAQTTIAALAARYRAGSLTPAQLVEQDAMRGR